MFDINNFKELLEYKKENEKITIAVAMSGGVDSSVTAYILKKQGYNVFGVTMITCEASVDSDAKKVCDDLGINHYVLDLTKSFDEKVISYFINEYEHGRTPNPCMVCNRYIKMGALIDFALEKGANFIATGHYSNIENGVLKVGNDLSKDQAYFLSQVNKDKLKYVIFPLGKIEKSDVREIGKYLGVRVYAKKDSQEICFVEDGKLKEFLLEKTHGKIAKEGNIIDTDGKILGKHKGLAFYTIGQRKGLGISSEKAIYVLKLDEKTNSIIMGSNEELFKEYLLADNINLLKVTTINELNGIECFAKTRSRDKFHKCKITVISDDEIKVSFIEDKVRAVTPGQGVVLYDENYEVIASGFIK